MIEEKPDLLTEIKGISYDKAQKISEVFCEQHELRRAMMFLQGYDISPAYAMKIYKKYKARTFEIVKNNPIVWQMRCWESGSRWQIRWRRGQALRRMTPTA